MKKQNKKSLFRRKGFYRAAIVVITLLLIGTVVIGLMPVMPGGMGGGFPQNMDRQQLPSDMQLPTDMQMPNMDSRENFQSGMPLQVLKSIWFPIAVILMLLDMMCFAALRRLRKQEKPRQETVHEDGEVHLTPQKKKTRRHSPWWGIAPLAVMLALVMVVQLFSGSTAVEIPRTQASILSGEATRSQLNITLPGSGTLTEEAAETIELVSGVEVSKWYVTDGDVVSAGDALASLDRVSVMGAIATVQDTIEELDDALSDWESDTLSTKLTAPTAGRVKEIYAKTGDTVADVMYEHGALMRISMDGMMAVDIETDGNLSVGDAVVVTLSDGAAETGRVESITSGTAVITLPDDGPRRGDEVTVSTAEGEILGNGILYIHSELKVTAYTGTVKTVSVLEEQKIVSGSVLMRLKDREDVATYESLVEQRSKLEAQMAELFRLYQSGMLHAPCDGQVSGVEDYIAANLSATGGAKLSLLANAPGSDPNAAYVNFIGKVTAVESGIWQVNLSPTSWDITDYAILEQLNLSDDLLTQIVTYTPTGAPIYTRSGNSWVSISDGQVMAGATVLFAFDPTDTSRLVWVVAIGGISDAPPAETEPTQPEATQPTEPDNTEPVQPDSPEATEPDSTQPTEPSGMQPTEPGSTEPTTPGGTAQTPPNTTGQNQRPGGTGSIGSFVSGSMQPEEEVVFEVEEQQILTITPQNTMSVTITVDELDILALEVGQTVQTTLDAMPGQSFAGTVTALGLLGSNSGGNSKFTAVIEIPRTDRMLSGMNASVSVMLESHEDILTVPLDALIEQDGKVYLYTAYDEKTETLSGLTEVTTGLSDGKNVQILSGISEGDSYYYSYLNTVNYETGTARSSGTGFPFGPMQ